METLEFKNSITKIKPKYMSLTTDIHRSKESK